MDTRSSLIKLFILEVVAGIVAIVSYEIGKEFFHSPSPYALAVILAVTLFTTSVVGGIWLARKIRRETRAAVEEKLGVKIADLEAKLQRFHMLSQEDFVRRTELHHSFVHLARDISVRYLGAIPLARRVNHRAKVIPAEIEPDMQKLLDLVAEVFQVLVPSNTKVFVAIRERRGREFVTILRGGNYNPSRKRVSKALPLDCRMVVELEKSFKKQFDCVIITGQNHEFWEPMDSDKFGEDLSVLMGAIFSKVLQKNSGELSYRTLEWILCVCADKEGVFTKSHTPLMKCFNDLFALLLNQFLRDPGSRGDTDMQPKPGAPPDA